MSEQEKKQQRIYDLLNAKTEPNNNISNWNFFMGLYQAQNLTPFITLYWTF